MLMRNFHLASPVPRLSRGESVASALTKGLVNPVKKKAGNELAVVTSEPFSR
jgi:hypothetical protein